LAGGYGQAVPAVGRKLRHSSAYSSAQYAGLGLSCIKGQVSLTNSWRSARETECPRNVSSDDIAATNSSWSVLISAFSLLDRLVHHSVILELNLPSYRLEQAQQAKQAQQASG
jgi:hypothetical protein